LEGKYLEEYMVINMKRGMEKSDESRTRKDERRRKLRKMDKKGKG